MTEAPKENQSVKFANIVFTTYLAEVLCYGLTAWQTLGSYQELSRQQTEKGITDGGVGVLILVLAATIHQTRGYILQNRKRLVD